MFCLEISGMSRILHGLFALVIFVFAAALGFVGIQEFGWFMDDCVEGPYESCDNLAPFAMALLVAQCFGLLCAIVVYRLLRSDNGPTPGRDTPNVDASDPQQRSRPLD